MHDATTPVRQTKSGQMADDSLIAKTLELVESLGDLWLELVTRGLVTAREAEQEAMRDRERAARLHALLSRG